MVSSPNRPEIFEFGDFRLIPGEGLLLRNGEPISLPPKAFEVFVLLVERNGHVVTRSEIIDMVWEETFVEEAAISKAIWAIRQVLEDDSTVPKFVQTVPKRGYRFVAPVEIVCESKDGPISGAFRIPLPNSDLDSASDNPGRRDVKRSDRVEIPTRRVKLPIVLAVSTFFFLGSYVLYTLTQGGSSARIESLAVLPFDNISGDPSQDYFAERISDALTSDLSKIADLRVRSLASVLEYSRKGKLMPEIGKDLAVDAIVTGSVSRAGDMMRISIQLTHAASDRNLWSKSYEREVREVLILQSEIARTVAGEIRSNLTPQEQSSLSVVRPMNPEAWEKFQLGHFYLNRQNKKDQDVAIASLEEAVELDPTFAAGYAELSQAYSWKAFAFTPDLAIAEKARVAAERSLSLDPNLAAGYLARGRLSWTPENKFPHEQAIKDYHRALTLDPALDEARNQLALVYCHIGALEEALREANEGVRLNPVNNLLYLRIGQTLNFQTRYEEAYTVLNAIPKETHPSVVGMQTAWALLNLGKMDEADEKLDQLLSENEDRGGTFASIKAVIAVYRKRPDEAERLIRQAIEKGKGYGHFHHTAYTIACAYSMMKNVDKAVFWLKEAADNGFPCYPLFEKDTYLDNLRRDSRFAAFLEKQRADWETRKSSL